MNKKRQGGMMKKQYLVLTVISVSVLLLLTACFQKTITLSEEGQTVALLEHPEEYPQCAYLDKIKVMSLVGTENSYQQALNKIYNITAQKNGTHIKIISAETDELSTTIWGEIYKCPLTPEGQIEGPPANKESWMIIEEDE